MSRQEKPGRSAGKPQVTPATIQDDLRGRDFTCNAIALSLNRASRGLLLDPMNGLADIERRELRSVNPYGFFDDPSRLLRLIRFQVRLGFTVEERTQMQIANAREAEVEKSIPPKVVGEELRRIAAEDSPADILKLTVDAGLGHLLLPLAGGPAKLNVAGVSKLERIARALPDDPRTRASRLGPFLYALTEKLTAKEKQGLIKSVELAKADVDQWQKLDARSKKLEAALRAPRIRKPSQVYHLITGAHPDEVLFLMYKSAVRPVQDRLKNYFQKYLPMVMEITPEEFAAAESRPGHRHSNKAREEYITTVLDRRPKKPEPVVEPPVVEVSGVARRAR